MRRERTRKSAIPARGRWYDLRVSGQLRRIVEGDLGVDAAYRHAPKQVTPGEPLEPEGAVLKWYGLHRADRPIPPEVTSLARRTVGSRPLEARGLGFVVLHRCGEDFYFLIVCTWRGSNELWQTVLYKDQGMTEFALWPRDAEHKPTFCVWELVPVLHEQRAWERFLLTARDEAAAKHWLGALFAGQT
jgi:hypothetical protein